MPKPEWGTKRLCASCGAKFYDFNRSEIICPACGAVYDPEAVIRTRRPPRSEPVSERAPKPKAVEEGEEDIGLELPEEEVLVDEEEMVEEDVTEPEIEEEIEEELVEEVEEEVLVVEPEEDEEEAAVIEDAEELGDEEEMDEVVDVDLDEEEER